MQRIAVFAGTRPEAIKVAPLVRAAAEAGGLEVVLVSTGQHRDMLLPVFELFDIEPAHSLDVMLPNQSLGELTANLTRKIDALLPNLEVDFCVSQGDTTTAFVSSLVAFYHQIPVGHIEAGLRSGARYSPFPEEINRSLISRLASLHFAPTEQSRQNLLAEGIADTAICVTGNTVIDALLLELDRQDRAATPAGAQLDTILGPGRSERPYVLITGHRRENFGAGFSEICSAIAELARQFPDRDFVYPVHLNPNVQEPVRELLGTRPNVRLLPPQGYSEFVTLMRHSSVILTDSGGIQEEAPSLGKPVLVMRDNTERPEGVDAGTVLLVGANQDRIVSSVSTLLTNQGAYDQMAQAVNPYGDGQASQRILDAITTHVSEAQTA
ncbi:MAG: UDP-N-acetylglucosamine 2-epimerase (non-hydrolyzing) [Planctomycetota bacterium]